jgi:hypothetical protein
MQQPNVVKNKNNFLKNTHCFLQSCKCNSILDLETKIIPDSNFSFVFVFLFVLFFGLLCNGCDEMQIMHFNLVMACFLIAVAVAAATAGYSVTESASICCKQKKKLAMKLLLMHQLLLLLLILH